MQVLNIIILFALCCTSALCVPKWPSSYIPKTTVHQRVSLRNETKCNVNVCFVIDGSRAINVSDFRNAIEFTQAPIGIFASDRTVNFGAVQYGRNAYPIYPVSENTTAVLHALEGAKSKLDEKNSIAAGIAYCDSQLAKHQGALSRIVLVGNGRNYFGADPILAANKYTARDPNGAVISVALGPDPHTGILQAIAAGNRVLRITEYILLAISIDDAIFDVCE